MSLDDMRTIKFRAWNGEKIFSPQELLDDDVHLNPSTGRFMRDGDNSCNDPECCGGPNPHWDDNHFVVMQYTGIKDKNGQEIYEGDIIAYTTDYARQISKNITVEWDGNQSGWFGRCPHGGKYRLYPIILRLLEVIGNIYENPELLK